MCRSRAFLLSAFVSCVCLCGVGQTPAPTGRPTVAEKIAANASKLDLNAATIAQLKALPGMGEEYAKRIVEGRPYTAKNQLTTRGIIPATAYERIKDLVVAHRVKS